MDSFQTYLDHPMAQRLVDMGLQVLAALGILLVGWYLSSWLSRRAKNFLLAREFVDNTIALFIAAVVRYGMLVLVIVTALAKFGVQSASIFAVLGAAGLAIGLALQGTLSNIAAGIMLIFLRPMRVGETIETGTLIGTVEAVGLFTTELRRFDGLYVSVPNSQIWSSQIINYTRNPSRRLEVVVGVSYGTNLDEARTALLEAARSIPAILPDPKPEVLVTAFSADAVNLSLRAWAPAAEAMQHWTALYLAAKKALDDRGIEIPFPQRVVHMVTGSPPQSGQDADFARKMQGQEAKQTSKA